MFIVLGVEAHTAQTSVVLMGPDITIQVKLQQQIFQCCWVQQLASINLELLVQISFSHLSEHSQIYGDMQSTCWENKEVKAWLHHFINIHKYFSLLNFVLCMFLS